MAPTLSPGDCVFAERLSLLAREPRPGDIIIFRTGRIPRLKEHGDQFYIMRIVAGAGDRIHWRDGHIYINGKERLEILSPRGLFTVPSYRFPETDGSVYVVPEASYYVIGDNSANSFDSRFWGAVPRSQIVFKPVIRYWPPSRFGPLERSGSELPGS